MKDYYLYTHQRKSDGEIFYIGKGSNNRANSNNRAKNKAWSRRSPEWHKIVEEHGGFTSSITAHGSEADILSLEKIVIKDLVAQGVELVNKLHNPNWIPPCRGRKFSTEHIKRLSEAHKGKKRSPLSDEHKAKISAGNKGQKRTDETKENIRQKQLGATHSESHVLNSLIGRLTNRKTKGYRRINNRYYASIVVYGKHRYLGAFGTVDEASQAYQEAKANHINKLQNKLNQLEEVA